ncbi:helix-turn-helix domain-containing protein [Tenggerimyces flavus]|uniref:Helix-turn-helix domain-containing protein n=1 Tax=Tenggerimyces flavus TaxID=1708749 RepID=A0ABV7YNR4_9ACTN|nr:helix-turn-helix domain-containing protein [Tenggerimyces flavus]MBM7789489.1 AraC-like DNA-binding protein [Tenggerimyces flavus]
MAEFEYVTRRPPEPLEPFVESIWYARGQLMHNSERIAPTGSTVAVFVLGSPILETPRNGEGEPFLAERGWLAGPHDGPVLNAPTAETHAVGIVSTPVGCRALFGVDPSPLRGRVEDLEHAWPAATALRDALHDKSPHDCLDAVEATLSEGLRPPPNWQRAAKAIANLEQDPRRPIHELATELGITHAHLDREFVRVVGLTPRVLARILRLRRVLQALDLNEGTTWTGIAAEWGWFDQSHFIRDFRRHTGVTPSAYRQAQRAAYDVGQQEPGFVPVM